MTPLPETPSPVKGIEFPVTIAGLTESQIHAYFLEASALAGFSIGYSTINPVFNTWENLIKPPYYHTIHGGITIKESVDMHNAGRPKTGKAAALNKLKSAQEEYEAELAKEGGK